MRVRPVAESTPDAGEAAAPIRSHRSERAAGLARAVLWMFVGALALQLGAGLYEHLAIVPRWCVVRGDEIGDAILRSGQMQAARSVWMWLSPLTIALALLNVFAAARAKGRARGWWLGAAALELLVSALTWTYFAPELVSLTHGTLTPVDTESRALAWASLNGGRIALEAFAFLLALAAFSRYGSPTITEPEPPSS